MNLRPVDEAQIKHLGDGNMNYNFSSITSVAECDLMITETVGEKLKTELMKFNSEGRVISDANAAVSMPSVVENMTTQL